MKSINEQLNIPYSNKSTHSMIYQPDMFITDPELNNLYNGDIVHGAAYYQQFAGWGDDREWDTFVVPALIARTKLYGRGQCRKECGSLFPTNRKLRNACKDKCMSRCTRKTKCPESYRPTRADVCQDAGLGPNCIDVQVGTGVVPDIGPGTTTGPVPAGAPAGSAEQKRRTNTMIWIGVGVIGLAAVGYFMFRKK